MDSMIFLLITLLIPLSSSSFPTTRNLDNNGLLTIEFTMVHKNKYLMIPFSIGVPEQSMNLVLDIGSERTWLHNSIYTSQSSSHFQSKNIVDKKTQDNFSISGVAGQDKISFASIELNNFSFLYVDKIEGTTESYGGLALGREFDSKSFSVVYRLSASTKTFFNSFSLKFTSETTGILYIGDLTYEQKDQTVTMDTCKLVNIVPKIKWGCLLTHAFVGELGNDITIDPNHRGQVYTINNKRNKLTEINAPAFFETIYNNIYVPMSFIDYLEKSYFIDIEDDKSSLCKKAYNAEEKMTSFTCALFEIAKLPKLHLVFDESVDLYLTPEDLFICLDDQCEFLIANKERITRWIIGIPLLKNYHTVFDYNDPTLSFYGTNNKAKVLLKEKGISGLSKVVVYFFISALATILITLGVIYLLRKKNVNRKHIETQIYENFNIK